MAERNGHSICLISQKSLFFMFIITSILFILSWLFVLRSTGRPQFIDHSLLPNSKLFAVNGKENYQPITKIDDFGPKIVESETPEKIDCVPNKVVLKVFMYDLPPEFHFGLLDWKSEGDSIWPDIRTEVPLYPGGLNLQHSIEYWLTLDILYSDFSESLRKTRSVIRVNDSNEADVIFVPFFSSLSYNRYSRLKPHERKSKNRYLQEKLVRFLTGEAAWKRSGGRDHIIVAHHPNSLLDARMKLWPAMFVLSDFGRYPPNVANVKKDVIAPYKHVVKSYVDDSSDFDSRRTLLYFQGAIYRKDGGYVRQELFYLLKEEKDVHFSFGSVQKDGIHKATQGMRSSKFCLNIAGDTPSSNRLFDAVASHCIPVIISDEIELPYEDVLDYSEFCVFVRTSDALKEKYLVNLVRGIGREEWTKMWTRLKEVENFFEFKFPSGGNDAVEMIWRAVARKVPAMKLDLHKSRRFSRLGMPKEIGLSSAQLPRNFS